MKPLHATTAMPSMRTNIEEKPPKIEMPEGSTKGFKPHIASIPRIERMGAIGRRMGKR